MISLAPLTRESTIYHTTKALSFPWGTARGVSLCKLPQLISLLTATLPTMATEFQNATTLVSFPNQPIPKFGGPPPFRVGAVSAVSNST